MAWGMLEPNLGRGDDSKDVNTKVWDPGALGEAVMMERVSRRTGETERDMMKDERHREAERAEGRTLDDRATDRDRSQY